MPNVITKMLLLTRRQRANKKISEIKSKLQRKATAAEAEVGVAEDLQSQAVDPEVEVSREEGLVVNLLSSPSPEAGVGAGGRVVTRKIRGRRNTGGRREEIVAVQVLVAVVVGLAAALPRRRGGETGNQRRG